MQFCRFIVLFFFLFVWGSSFKVTAQTLHPLKGIWQFKADYYAEGLAAEWFRTTDASHWDSLLVPERWQHFLPYQQFEGIGWYYKRIVLPTTWQGNAVQLCIEHLPPNAMVWVNGNVQNGSVKGVITRFSPQWRSGVNHVIIRLNTLSDYQFLQEGSGLLGNVWLQMAPLVRFGSVALQPTTDRRKGVLTVQGAVTNTGKQAATVEVSGYAVLTGVPNPDTLRLTATPISVAASNTQSFACAPETLRNAEIWHVDTPLNYRVQLFLTSGTDTLQQMQRIVGFRTQTVKNKQISLNNELLHWVGMLYDVAPPYTLAAQQHHFTKMKQAGVSVAVLPLRAVSSGLLDYLSEIGMMVWIELPPQATSLFTLERLQGMMSDLDAAPSLLGWLLHEPFDSQWRSWKSGHRAFLAQVLTPNEGTLPPLQGFADVAFVQHSTASVTDLNAWGAMLSDVPFAYLRSSTTPDYPGLPFQENTSVLPSHFSGGVFMAYSVWAQQGYQSSDASIGERYEANMRQFMLLDSLVVSHSGQLKPKKQIDTFVEIRPARSWRYPAHTLRNYRLVWFAKDYRNQVVEGDVATLKEITPGDKSFIVRFTWRVPREPYNRLVYQVVSPQNVVVYADSIFQDKPAMPDLRFAYAHETLRIQFPNTLASATSIRLYNVGKDTLYLKPGIYAQRDVSLPQFNANAETWQGSLLREKRFTQFSLSKKALQTEGEPFAPFVQVMAAQPPFYRVVMRGAKEQTTKYVQIASEADSLTTLPSLASKQSFFYVKQASPTLWVRGKVGSSAWSEAISAVPASTTPQKATLTAMVRFRESAALRIALPGHFTQYQIEYKGSRSGIWKATPSYFGSAWVWLSKLNRRETYVYRICAYDIAGNRWVSEEFQEN